MKKYALIITTMFLFLGCSGKVQTNPLPDEKVYHLPQSVEYKKPAVSSREKEKFNEYANSFFGKKGFNQVVDSSDEEIDDLIQKRTNAKEQAKATQEDVASAKKSNNIWGVGYERAKNSY